MFNSVGLVADMIMMNCFDFSFRINCQQTALLEISRYILDLKTEHFREATCSKRYQFALYNFNLCKSLC